MNTTLYSDFFANPEFEQRKEQKKSCVQLSRQSIHFVWSYLSNSYKLIIDEKNSKVLLLIGFILFLLNIKTTSVIKAHIQMIQRDKQRPVITKPVLIGWCLYTVITFVRYIVVGIKWDVAVEAYHIQKNWILQVPGHRKWCLYFIVFFLQ